MHAWSLNNYKQWTGYLHLLMQSGSHSELAADVVVGLCFTIGKDSSSIQKLFAKIAKSLIRLNSGPYKKFDKDCSCLEARNLMVLDIYCGIETA